MTHSETPAGPGPGPASPGSAPRRRTRDTVLGILHFVVGALTVPWLVAQLLVLLAVLSADAATAGLAGGTASRPSLAVLALITAFTGLGLLAQVTAGVGLLKGARWGRQLSWIYAGLAIAAGLLLWLVGGRVLLATVWLIYPVTTAVLLASPPGPSASPPGPPASPPGPSGPSIS